MEDVCELMDMLVGYAKTIKFTEVDTKEYGELIDMVKDLAEAEYYLAMAAHAKEK